MRTTQSIQFYCRQSKANKLGLAPLEISVSINGQRRFINLPIKFSPSEFNKKRPSAEITTTIDTWRTKINLLMVDMMQHNIPITTDTLRETIQTGGVQTYTIAKLFEEYLSILRQRVGSSLSKGVYRKYELVRDIFFAHIDSSKECTAISNSVIQSFYAKLDTKYDKSTSAGYMTKLKTFINFGIDNGKIKINPFQSVKIQKGKKDITYLSESEIKTLYEANFDNKSLQQVLDCFIVMCGTGLAYIDLKNLRREDIQEKDGTHYIHKQRTKTGEEFTAVIMPWAYERIVKYDGNLPVISNQKLNCYLHTIEDLLHFPKRLHCHLARHSYATLLLNKSVPISTVAKTLGHSNVKQTSQFYAKVLTSTVIDEVASIF